MSLPFSLKIKADYEYYRIRSKNKETIILLHGGGLSWWNYREVAKTLEKDFHIILPILDGHAGSDRDFINIEDNASQIIKYIDEHLDGQVLLIGGLSLGAQILVEILSQRENICRFVMIESALVLPLKLTHYLVESMINMSYRLISRPWFARLQFKSLKMPNALFDEYFEDTCRITKENMISFLKANSSYQIKNSLQNAQAEVHIFVGQKETHKMQLSAKLLQQRISGSVLEIIPQFSHGEFSINHAEEYAEKLLEIVRK